MKESKIKVVMCEPNKLARVVEIDNNLETFQKIVGGYIQATYPFEDYVSVVLDDDGKCKGYELNRALKVEDKIVDFYVGTFFICGLNGEHFGSLSDELVEKYSTMFKYPELFFRASDGIKAIPYNPKN